MTDLLVQRVLMPLQPSLARLYVRARRSAEGAPSWRRRSVVLPRGTALRTDTYFNGFFEGPWRTHTSLGQLDLRVRTSGAGRLRLYRRAPGGARTLLAKVDLTGQGAEASLPAPAARDEPGLLFFELRARSRLVLHRAEWWARNVEPRPVRLVAGYCTFDREPLLLRNVAALVADSAVRAILAGVVVVDQGSRKVRDHLAFGALARRAGPRLTLLDQSNFGGAGGFTRCLLEALDTETATHALLMDDDAILDPESVLRAAAFLALARNDLAVGGQMLDRSRPRELVEAGARYLPERITTSPHVRRRVDRPADLAPLLTARPIDYNGWWFFALPLALLDRARLPLPLFLRGDDVEFGYRLLRAGVPTVPLPGVAVWHEPFESKGRGWHAYYDLRNMLVVGALHFPAPRAGAVARRFLHRLLDELLACDYGEAWLMCEAVADFLRGPDALRPGPQRAHQRLRTACEKLATTPLRGSLPTVSPPPPSPRRLVRCARRLGLIARHLIRPSPPADALPRHALRAADENAHAIGGLDVVAVDDPHQEGLVVLRRCRGQFVRLFLRGLGLGLRLLVAHRQAARRWREGAPALTTRSFWRAYLGLSGPQSGAKPQAAGPQGCRLRLGGPPQTFRDGRTSACRG